MKDRNTTIFYFVMAFLSIIIALTAPLTFVLFKPLFIIIGVSFFLFGIYFYAVIQSKKKSAFTISRIKNTKSIRPKISHPKLERGFTETDLKRQ